MSAPEKSAAPPGGHRLAIIHLLGWMAGVAVVLAMYRTALETGWLEVNAAGREELRWWQTAYGLVYGTAISGMGLLLYRRLRGDRTFPEHPGHWLLVFGGVAFLTDAIAFVLAKGIIIVWKEPGWYYPQQALAWGMALAVAVVVLARLRTDWNWWLLAGLISALIAVNWLTHVLVLAEYVAQACGGWIFGSGLPLYLTHWTRIVGTAICLASLPVVLGADRRPRDWLHWVGVVALVALAIVEEADQIQVIARAR